MSEGWKPMSQGGGPPQPPAPAASSFAAPGVVAEPKKSDRTALYVILGVAALIFLCCGGLMGLGAYIAATAPEATPEDRAAVINIFDVYGWVEEGDAPDAAWEVLEMGPSFLGSQEWDYEYDAPESEDQWCFVSSSRTDESTASEARSTFSTLKFASGLGARMIGEDIEVVDVSEMLVWGDQNYLGRMDGTEGPVGHILVTRRDKTVLFAVFGVVYFADAEAVEEFLVPVLERAVSYEQAPVTDP